MNIDIMNILSDLKKIMSDKVNLYELDFVISDAVRYILMYPKALDFPLPLNEEASVKKLMSILNAWDGNALTAERFQEFFIMSCAGLEDRRMRDLIANLILWSLDEETAQLSKLTELGLEPISTALCRSTCLRTYSSSTISSVPSTTSQTSTEMGQLVRCSYDMMPFYVDLNCQPYDGQLVEASPFTDNFSIGCEIIQNGIYALIGMSGKFLLKDSTTGRLSFNPRHERCLVNTQKSMLLRLAEAGYFHDQLKRFSSLPKDFIKLGSINKAFLAKIKKELNDYHGQVSHLQDKLNEFRQAQFQLYLNRNNKWLDCQQPRMTFLKLLNWYVRPLCRLQWLTRISSICQLRKGGQLVSTLFNYHKTGNPYLFELARELLTITCIPLMRMISMWMLDGTFEDNYGEFFIESVPDIGEDRLWYDKFRVRLHMLPKFINRDMAEKILKTGKSIHFLREICQFDELIQERAELKDIIENRTAQIYSTVLDTNWHAAIERCYSMTSKHVLATMVGPHKLLVHLQGMRRYLLLGQGDFVSIFIEHIKDELDKLGRKVNDIRDLSNILDAALRCTNAQYDDPEILSHLDVVVRSPYPGDCGWDVISLHYTVQGPLATMLEPMMPMYKTLFKPLWRMKHMEFVLSTKLWKEQMINAKALSSMATEINKATYKLHFFTSELMHFLHELLYYVLFEVIECNWVILVDRMKRATDLDEILDEHSKFLDLISTGCFTKTEKGKTNYLELVYSTIINLVDLQTKFYKNCFAELKARKRMERAILDSERSGHFGITTAQKLDRDQERKLFHYVVETFCQNLELTAMSYGKAMSIFLVELNSSDIKNLQLFGTRLDFNEHYKKRFSNVSKPLTFEHLRQSQVNGTTTGRFSLFGNIPECDLETI